MLLRMDSYRRLFKISLPSYPYLQHRSLKGLFGRGLWGWCFAMNPSNDFSFAFSHKSDDWASPKWILDLFSDFYDPCPLHADFNGLLTDWHGRCVYCNPPYSKVSAFVDKAIASVLDSNTFVALLVPARFDTKWMQRLFDFGCLFVLFRKRLRFGGSKTGAPFPSVMVFLAFHRLNSVVRYDDSPLDGSLRDYADEWFFKG